MRPPVWPAIGLSWPTNWVNQGRTTEGGQPPRWGPNRAISEADKLVGEVMAARGYPVGDFDQRVEDISVDHPDVVMN